MLRVEDLKPIFGHEVRETLDAGDLIYFRDAQADCVVIIGEGIGVHPQQCEPSNNERYSL